MLRLMQGVPQRRLSLASMTQELERLLEIALCTTVAAVLLFSRRTA